MLSISANLNVMIKAAEKASKSIIRDFGEIEKLQVSKKGPHDFVTKTDKHVEKILIEELSKTKKNYSFLTEETGAIIEVEDSGKVTIYGDTPESRESAQKRIEEITAEPEVNKIYTGTVANIKDFGAFVTIMPGRDGLVHVSEISEERVENVSDYFVEGEEVQVKVLEVDRQGKIRLTMKGLED